MISAPGYYYPEKRSEPKKPPPSLPSPFEVVDREESSMTGRGGDMNRALNMGSGGYPAPPPGSVNAYTGGSTSMPNYSSTIAANSSQAYSNPGYDAISNHNATLPNNHMAPPINVNSNNNENNSASSLYSVHQHYQQPQGGGYGIERGRGGISLPPAGGGGGSGGSRANSEYREDQQLRQTTPYQQQVQQPYQQQVQQPYQQQVQQTYQQQVPSHQQQVPSHQQQVPSHQQQVPSHQQQVPSQQQQVQQPYQQQVQQPYQQQVQQPYQQQMPSHQQQVPSHQQQVPSHPIGYQQQQPPPPQQQQQFMHYQQQPQQQQKPQVSFSQPSGAWGHQDPAAGIPPPRPAEGPYGQFPGGGEGSSEIPFSSGISTPLSLQKVKNDGAKQGSNNGGAQPTFASTSFSRLPVNAALPSELLRIHRIPLGTEMENPEIPHLLPQHLMEDFQQHPGKPPQLKMKLCSLRAVRPTSTVLPGTKAVSDLIPLPVGITVSPMVDGNTLPVATFSGCKQMIRCRKCGAYVNPFTMFGQQGYQFQCVCCRALCQVPSSYYCSLDPRTGLRLDREQRPELTCCSVDFQATPEFLTTPPRRQVITLLLDCSHGAVTSGLLSSMCSGALRALEQLKTEEQLQMGIIGYDSLIHFFRITELDEPEMISAPDVMDDVSRITENFHIAGVELPCPIGEILVPIKEKYKQLRHVLTKLPTMFGLQNESGCAFGTALSVVMTLLSDCGGKVIAGITSSPLQGEGTVKSRFDVTKLSNQAKEHTICQPGTEWYKNRALSCSSMSISVDLVIGGTRLTEIASILPIARYTGGHVYQQKETNKGGLSRTVEHCLTRFMGSDAIMRVRASTGIAVTSYYGHFHVAEVDLLSLPVVDEDMAYAVELTVAPKEVGKFVYVQFSTVYTTRSRERRIRVHTAQFRVGDSLTSVINSLDCLGVASLLLRSTVDRVVTTPFATLQKSLTKTVGTLLRNVQVQLNLQGVARSQADLNVPASIKYLPQILIAFLRYSAIGGAMENVVIPPSVRMAAISMILTSRIEAILGSIMGWTYTLYNPRIPMEELPSFSYSSFSRFSENTVQLTHTGTSLIVWVGQRVERSVLEALHLEQPRSGEETQVEPPPSLTGVYERLTELCQYLRDITRSCYYAALVETPQGNTVFQTELQPFMQESNCVPHMSYQTYLKLLWTESGPNLDKK